MRRGAVWAWAKVAPYIAGFREAFRVGFSRIGQDDRTTPLKDRNNAFAEHICVDASKRAIESAPASLGPGCCRQEINGLMPQTPLLCRRLIADRTEGVLDSLGEDGNHQAGLRGTSGVMLPVIRVERGTLVRGQAFKAVPMP